MNGPLVAVGLIVSLLSGSAPPDSGGAWPSLGSQTVRPRGDDLTCSDFPSQTEAQLVYEADRGDPFGLDVDLDGIACETPIVVPVIQSDATVPEATAAPSPTPEPTPTVEAPPTERPARARRPRTPTPVPPRDIDCEDFDSQQEAQAFYDRNPGDPFNLDPSGDGFACALLPSRDG